jgi:hypothetical protein
MKKVLPILGLVIVAVLAWYLSAGSVGSKGGGSTDQSGGSTNKNITQDSGGPNTASGDLSGEEEFDDNEGISDEDIKPAVEKYKNAEEALNAVKAAAASYDDLVLEQFTMPGEECSWCPEFYAGVKELLFAADTKPDQRSFFAEVMAVSGRTENLAALLDGARNAPSQEERDIYTEALELTLGKDDVVKFLGENINTDNPAVKEAVIAAVTNQGSRLAAEILYKQAVDSGDPDGSYSLGIGLGELVPEPTTIPYLQEMMLKRDNYSHLAVKSLLNGGIDGLRVVFDAISNSKDPEADRKMLKDAIDHVNFDEESENFVKQYVDATGKPVAQEFAKKILEDFKAQEAAMEEDANSVQE